jgi:hypothetical protein
MPHNIALGPAAGTNHALEILRGQNRPLSDWSPETGIAPALHLVLDPDAVFDGHWSSPRGRLLDLEGEMRHPARWFALHVPLDALDLSDRAILGFAARLSAPQTLPIRACLRSGRPGGFSDCFFDKPVLPSSDAGLHLDVLDMARHDISDDAPWRDLVLFLPTRAFRLSLHDLRLFVV